MTVFDLEESKGVWFELEGGGRVQLRSLSISDWKDIRKKTVTKKIEYKRVEGKAERFVAEDVNNDLENELFWDAVIVAWENLYDVKGKEIPCTKENKIMLMEKSKKFAAFIAESLNTLTEQETAQIEVSEKNS
jgi:hypothetical protein